MLSKVLATWQTGKSVKLFLLLSMQGVVMSYTTLYFIINKAYVCGLGSRRPCLAHGLILKWISV